MSVPKEKTSLQQHLDALSICRDGKPTEGVLMRFNEQEFYLLNLTAIHATHKGYVSRQAWMRAVILEAMQNEMRKEEEMQSLVNKFFTEKTE